MHFGNPTFWSGTIVGLIPHAPLSSRFLLGVYATSDLKGELRKGKGGDTKRIEPSVRQALVLSRGNRVKRLVRERWAVGYVSF